MASTPKSWGVKITLDDIAAPVSTDATIGLYSRNTTLMYSASIGNTYLIVNSISGFAIGDAIYISDPVTGLSEKNQITNIAASTFYLLNVTQHAYNKDNACPVNANSYFAWTQGEITGLTGWMYGVISDKGLGTQSRCADWSKGGNVSNPVSWKVTIKNVNKFHVKLSNLGLTLVGMLVEKYEFSGTTPTRRLTGAVESVEYDANNYYITIKGGRNNRNANITTQSVSSGATTENLVAPVVFGGVQKSKPIITKSSIKLQAKDIPNYSGSWSTEESLNENFLIIGYAYTTTPILTVQFREDVLWPSINYSIVNAFFIGKYICISSGNAQNQVRRIIACNAVNNNACQFTLSAWLSVIPAVNTDWVNIYDGPTYLSYESWPSIGMTGNVYTFDSPNYYLLRNIMSTLTSTGFTINVDFSENGIDSFASFISVAAPSYKYDDSPTLLSVPSYLRNANGVYYYPGLEHERGFGDLGSYREGLKDAHNGCRIIRGWSIEIAKPALQNVKINKCYLVLDDTLALGYDSHITQVTSCSHAVSIVPRYYLGHGVAKSLGSPFTYDTGYNLRNSYDSSNYYEKFLGVDITVAWLGLRKNGYRFMDTGITSDEYNSVKSIFLISILDFQFNRNGDAIFGVAYYRHIPYGFIIETSTSYTDIYVELSGRIFNSTWGARRKSTDLIESPLDVFEHLCRLQAYPENGTCPDISTPTIGWGKAYATGAKIKLSGTGSFDRNDDNLNLVRDFKMARGIYSYDEAYIDTLKQSLCYDFDLVNWIDADGNECIDRLKALPSDTPPATTLTLFDITDRKAIKITEPQPNDIYCEPFVQYDINPADGKYQGIIKITNSGAATFDASYVHGLEGGDALALWTACHALWLKCRMVAVPPSQMTDLKNANGSGSFDIARERITRWVEMMAFPRIEFPSHYNIVGTWEEGQRFNITLPNQTNGVTIECMVEKIDVTHYAPFECTVTAIMFDAADVVAEYVIQNTPSMTGDNIWQDTPAMTGDNVIQNTP